MSHRLEISLKIDNIELKDKELGESLFNLEDADLTVTSDLEGNPEIIIYGLCEHFKDNVGALNRLLLLLSASRDILESGEYE